MLNPGTTVITLVKSDALISMFVDGKLLATQVGHKADFESEKLEILKLTNPEQRH